MKHRFKIGHVIWRRKDNGNVEDVGVIGWSIRTDRHVVMNTLGMMLPISRRDEFIGILSEEEFTNYLESWEATIKTPGTAWDTLSDLMPSLKTIRRVP
jgi:hypothetical protein